MENERRKHTRYKIENAVSINPEGVYQLSDISEGGFCFKCDPHTPLPEKWVTDIINSIIHLDEFPARKIWVSLYENGKTHMPNFMSVGVKFSKLAPPQKNNLNELLDSISRNQML